MRLISLGDPDNGTCAQKPLRSIGARPFASRAAAGLLAGLLVPGCVAQSPFPSASVEPNEFISSPAVNLNPASVAKFGDEFVDELCLRMLRVLPLQCADLDETMLGKSSSLAIPGSHPSISSASLSHPFPTPRLRHAVLTRELFSSVPKTMAHGPPYHVRSTFLSIHRANDISSLAFRQFFFWDFFASPTELGPQNLSLGRKFHAESDFQV